MISTLLPGLKASVVEKTVRVFEDRLRPLGAALAYEARSHHDIASLTAEIRLAAQRADLIVVFGASAITDRRDVIPAALEAAGGRIEHFGMPVDPGNLLLIGELDGKPVMGAPGCARSPKENGFDWVLQRLIAGAPIGRREIQRMGVGGLLMEISTRPQPRAAMSNVEAILLAAGSASRYRAAGGAEATKLIANYRDEPLVRAAARAALDAGLRVTVVTGHASAEVERGVARTAARVCSQSRLCDGHRLVAQGGRRRAWRRCGRRAGAARRHARGIVQDARAVAHRV